MSIRRIKITLIGAGSIVFTRNLLGDIFSYPELADCEVALHDIDEHRLGLAEGTIKIHLHRALAALRDLLKNRRFLWHTGLRLKVSGLEKKICLLNLADNARRHVNG